MRSNKKIIIIISIILTVLLAITIFAYMFIATDIFRSDKELFAKYFLQNEEMLQKITDLQVSKIYKNLENENKYETNTTIKVLQSEGGEVSNPLNDLSVELNIQRDNEEQYMYANTQILYEDESYLEAELIKQQEQYGIKIPEVAKKFVAIENDENIGTIANEIGIDIEQLEMLIGIINGDVQGKLGDGEDLYNKYANMIKTGISSGRFEKQKNAVITYNDVTTKTNAYSVLLSEEQVQNILSEVKNSFKSEITDLNEEAAEMIGDMNEELEVPAIKVTVYEQQQKTIRTIFEIGTYKIVLENYEQNGETKIIINCLENQDEQCNIEISKVNTGNQEELKIITNIAEEEYIITLLNDIQSMNDETTVNTEISYEQDITRASLKIESKINTSDFEKTELLERNNVLLNELEGDTRKNFINVFKQRISEKITEKMILLAQKIMPTNENPSDEEMPQVEINKFNAKFEFYTGDEVSAENVKVLLDIVKENIKNHEIITVETNENEASTEKTNMKIYIEKDKTNEDSMTEILGKIEDNKKYKVSISYKQSDGLIDYITITEI